MKRINQIVFIFSLFITCLSYAMWTDLHQAVKNGDLWYVQELLDRGANVNVFDQEGYTPLHVAAANGKRDMINLLLDVGANVDVLANNHVTPLDQALMSGQEVAVNFLLKRGASVHFYASYFAIKRH